MGINNISFWMDNAPSHFRTKELIAGYYWIQKNNNMKVHINYFAEYHGKSECDTHFGLISKVYTNYISYANNPDINTEGL